MIAVCLKWVEQRPGDGSVQPPGGRPDPPDPRFCGVSRSDEAALEWALRCRDTWPAETVTALTVGPPAAASVLIDALAAGADRAVRIEAPFGVPSRLVSRMLAEQIPPESMVFCGDFSCDRATGSVPAFLAADLGIGQALGLVQVVLVGERSIRALRRVDGGRRDRLAIDAPAVMSVEASTAALRRAPLRPLLDLLGGRPSGTRCVETVAPSAALSSALYRAIERADAGTSRPYRPRPRLLEAPAGATALDRIKALSASAAAFARADPVTLEPGPAAEHLLEALAAWAYLPGAHDVVPPG